MYGLDENGSMSFTMDEQQAAADQEETERLRAEVQYYKNRVVLLRALANRLSDELEELQPKPELAKQGEGVEPYVDPEENPVDEDGAPKTDED